MLYRLLSGGWGGGGKLPYLCSLHVNSASIEVVHTNVTLRSHRMSHRSRVLGILTASQTADIFDSLHCFSGDVRGEPLVTEYSQS